MTAITGRDIAPAICKALGIEIKGARKIDIHIARDCAVTVTIERLVQDYEAKQLTSDLEVYELVRRGSNDVVTMANNGEPLPCP